jgi:catechol 2,3-dioxygenase-like lactoylglutathione lyase family enzyme
VFDHVTIRASDREASERFYATVLATLARDPSHAGPEFVEWHDFSLAAAGPDAPVTRGLHIGFGAPSREAVDAFWRAGVEAGYRDDGAPGPRPEYGPDYYGAFLLDPDGNSAEAVRHRRVAAGVVVDHLWIRTADLPASAAFYDAIGHHAGFARSFESAERIRFSLEGGGSFSLVAGRPTEGLHVAFRAWDDASVEAFHEAALDAGYRDNGRPGERVRYHPGYYAAYALDPDGHNVEVVNHDRGAA